VGIESYALRKKQKNCILRSLVLDENGLIAVLVNKGLMIAKKELMYDDERNTSEHRMNAMGASLARTLARTGT